jgi:hypothetical protein
MSAADNDNTLFISDVVLHQRMNPRLGRDSFRAAIRALEARHPDFPRINVLFKGRYWPAVKAWFDRHSGISQGQVGGEDGEETWPATHQG